MNFKSNESAQKLRGGYYTPIDLASFIARWIDSENVHEILEPSCGEGVFFEALASVRSAEGQRVTAFELDSVAAQRSILRAKTHGICAKVHESDFLDWANTQISTGGVSFDAIVGNPPFIRYQYLPEVFQNRAEQVFRLLGCKFTKHTNAWVPFVLASIALLRPGGRLGMIIPSEIISVMHAQSLRSYLGTECKRFLIIDPKKLWFSHTLQGAVMLLAEKRHSQDECCEGLRIVSVLDREFIREHPESLFFRTKANNGRTIAGKWTRALLDSATRELIDELNNHPSVHRFGDVATVGVGIVTGANKSFLVSKSVVERYMLFEHSYPMFGRSEHCPGILYDRQQHTANDDCGKPTNFIWLKDDSALSNNLVKKYIEDGECQRIHKRFKCRIRNPWYCVTSVYATEIGMLKRAHDAPRLIFNEVGAFTTDTVYRIRSATPPKTLVSSFLNPLTALSAELEGRYYGGGVLELVPSEIEKLIIPLPSNLEINIVALDEAVKTKKILDVFVDNGGKILNEIGVRKHEQQQLIEGWLTLRNRRHRIATAVSSV